MLAFICISHSGELELKTAFLIFTLKKYYTGNYKIYVCIPHQTKHFNKPSDVSFGFYHDHNVEIITFRNPLLEKRNDLLKGDLTSNKIYTLAHDFKEDIIIFLDSDIMAIQKFNLESLLSGSWDLLLKPANRSNISSWAKIYNLFNQKMPDTKVTTSIDKKIIPPYFNAGVIGIRNKFKEIFWPTWVKYFELMSGEISRDDFNIPVFHRDQVALSLAINEHESKYKLLPEEYNFPSRGKKIYTRNLPKLVHYHHPYSIYSTSILKREFKEFIAYHSEFKDLIKRHAGWNNLFGSNKVNALFTGFFENIKYKKYIVTKKFRERLSFYNS